MRQRAVRVIDVTLVIFAILAGLMLGFQALAVAGDAVLRASGRPLRWVHEVSTLLLVAESLLAAPYALRRGAHFRVTILVQRLSPQVQLNLRRALWWVAIFALLIFTYHSGMTALDTFERGIRAPTLLRTPIFLPQAMLPLGGLLMVAACVAELLDPSDGPASPLDEGQPPTPKMGGGPGVS